MCFALFIASASFFLGQAKVIPEPLRIFPVLTVLALLPLAFMLYWLVRLRIRRQRSTAHLEVARFSATSM
jgi:peptidoglycan/LPS O-acetylase OafA/YrhL